MKEINGISKDNVSVKLGQRRTLDVNGIRNRKHLGFEHQPNASVTASSNTGCSSSVMTNDSQFSNMYMSKQAKKSISDMSVSCSETSEGSAVRAGSLEENEFPPDVDCTRMLEESSLPTSFGKREPSQSKKAKSVIHSLKFGGTIRSNYPKNKSYARVKVFDICQSEAEAEEFIRLRSPVDFLDEAEETVDELCKEQEPAQRVSIVKKCRELGIGPGGFYRPGYKDGAKLRLHMMCLGLDWDPQTRKYRKRRQIDRCKPPAIPPEFRCLVDKAILDSLTLIKRGSTVSNAEDILPRMNPDICIVNFYSEIGRLGLHQDRDESTESVTKGLPVVSFSLGDSAEFLYADHRNENKAENVILESGDVLIFGGQSRHVFHGISSIIPNSAPHILLQETKLRPGRLNLTFRQY
ncbi:Alpha-ketoglutarate-dependent dioxygenase AlkB-like protein [Bienertia sinuspersici]